MAIGDNNNSNLFGTNYNAEEEERKKAELAARNARMGAGGVGTPSDRVFVPSLGMAPQSLVDQVTQLPPMQEPIPIEVAPPITNDVANGGMQLREPKQTDGGVLGLGSVDVESPFDITRSPDFSNLNLNGVNLQIPPELQFDTPGTGEVGLTNLFDEGSLPRIVTESAGATGDFVMEKTKDLVEFLTGRSLPAGDKTTSEVERSLAFLQSPEVQASMKAAQAPSGGAQEQGQSIPQGAPGSAQANFATRMATGEPLTPQEIQDAQSFAASMGTTFDPVTGYSREPFENSQQAQGQVPAAPAGGLTTVGGASLSEFLSGQAMPEQGFTQEESPLGGRGVTLTQDQMNTLSAEREARLDARPDFGEAVSDRDRRAARGDGISMADQTAMAKANARDATPSEVARGNQVANALGVELKTGQPLQATGGLTETERLNREKFLYQQGQDILAGKVLDQEAAIARTEAFETSRNNVRSTQDSYEKLKPVAEEIANLSGSKFTEGMLGWTASKLPFSTDAAQIERLTTEFEGSAFLQGLIDAKSKGATFGALSEREGDRILGQWGKITSPKSTNKERISAINSMLGSIQRAAERAQSDHRERFPELFNQTNPSSVQGTGQRYNNDQDHGAAVETHFVG